MLRSARDRGSGVWVAGQGAWDGRESIGGRDGKVGGIAKEWVRKGGRRKERREGGQ